MSGEAPDIREQEDCPSGEACDYKCDQHEGCTDCGDLAEFTPCRNDFGERCASCHVAGCRECQDGLADQDAAEAAHDGRWS